MAAATMVADEAAARVRTDEELLEAAVREHARLVFRIAYSILRNHHDAEDATQETFARATRHLRKLREIDDLRAWLARVVWRIAVDRRPKTMQIALDELEQSSGELRSEQVAADDLVLGEQLQHLLEPMIASLPVKLRDPLTLSTVEELSPRDISQVLGINEAAVRSRLFRARQILKEKLAGRLTGRLGERHGT